MTSYHPIESKSIVRRQVDPWFLGNYGLNLYRGCEHGCLYCKGRAERFNLARQALEICVGAGTTRAHALAWTALTPLRILARESVAPGVAATVRSESQRRCAQRDRRLRSYRQAT